MFPKGMSLEVLDDIGIFPSSSVNGFMTDEVKTRVRAGDAALVTQTNNGVPLWMLTYFDPKIIEILTSPLRAEKIFKPEKRGDWTNPVMQFNLIEHTGEVQPYGDYAEDGDANINVNYPIRQSYTFQTMASWGDKQIAEYGKAKINYHQQKEIAAAKTIKIAHNTIWFYGVSGLMNYGILNDPDLPMPTAPIPAGTGGTLVTWEQKATDPNGALYIYEDIRSLYTAIVDGSGGLISMDDKMKLVMSNTLSTYLAVKSSFNVSVRESLKEAFPNLEIVTAPEYSTEAGELIQLVVDELEGVPTGILAYTELERSHGVVRAVSSYKEKKSAGSWGCVIFRPFGIAGMLGV